MTEWGELFGECSLHLRGHLIKVFCCRIKSTVLFLRTEYPIKQSVELASGEGNGTPLQYSCLENPMDGGAW